MTTFTLWRRWLLVASLIQILQRTKAADVSPSISPSIAPFAPNSTVPPIAPVIASPTGALPSTPTTPVPSGAAPITLPPITLAPNTPRPTVRAPTTSSPLSPTPISPAPVAPVQVTSDPVAPAPVTFTPVLSPLTPPSENPVDIAPNLPEATSPPSILSPSASPTMTVTGSPTSLAPASGTTSPPISPTIGPSQARPSESTQLEPSNTPTQTLTERPNTPISASSVPTLTPTNPSPPAPEFKPPLFRGLSMTLTGVSPLPNEVVADWQRTTSNYVLEYYDTALDVTDVTVAFEVTEQNPPFSRRLMITRQLQTTNKLTLTFNQLLTFRSSSPNISPENVIVAPFSTESLRAEYVRVLKSSNENVYADLVSVSPISFPEGGDRLGLGLGLAGIIGIAVGAFVGLLVLVFAIYCAFCRKSKPENEQGYNSGNSGKVPVSSVKGRMHAGSDDVSTLADPVTDKTNVNKSLPGGYGDQSVATVDYDYSKAYGGGGEASVVSSSGGTFGSGTHGGQTTLGDLNTAGGDTLAGGSFDGGSVGTGAVRDPNTPVTKEVLLDIYAPAGKLGVVIDTPDNGAPVVHAIKDSSVIANKLHVGDKLVAVDDEDVRNMTAIKVSKLISRKSANATRKLSVIRTTIVGE